jgi:hypothetical protein
MLLYHPHLKKLARDLRNHSTLAEVFSGNTSKAVSFVAMTFIASVPLTVTSWIFLLRH